MSEEDSSYHQRRSNSFSQEIISYINENEHFYDGFSLENIALVKDLGFGAFGKVQKVIDTVSKKEYARKTLVISDDLSEEAILSEIELLEKLRNLSNIPKFLANYYGYCIRSRVSSKEFRQYDIILGFKPYSLAKLIETKHRSSNPFTENQIFDFFLTMIEGLSVLQSHNIVHRDIKPQNIICDENLGTIDYKLIDFGESKFVVEKTAIHTIRGTPSFMAPELRKAYMEDKTSINVNFFKADTFSLGLVILNMGLPNFMAIRLNNYNEKVFEEFTQRQFRDFQKIYISNTFLCKSLKKMLRLNPDERITCQDLWIEYKYNKWVKSTFQKVFGIKYFINLVLLWIVIINFYSGF